MDVMFLSESKLPIAGLPAELTVEFKKQDANLATAFARFKKVSITYPLLKPTPGMNLVEPREIKRFAINRQGIHNFGKATLWSYVPFLPIKKFTAYAKPGFANLSEKEKTATITKVPLVAKVKVKSRKYFLPNIDLLAVCDYYRIDCQQDVEVKFGENIELKNISKNQSISIPIDNAGFMEIKYRKLGNFQSYSLAEILQKPKMAKKLKDKLVILALYGASGATTPEDTHPTPLHPKTLGADIRANILATILSLHPQTAD